MTEMYTVAQIAERWGIPQQQVTRYCREERIEGVVKAGRAWMIPCSAVKPDDLRKKEKKAGSRLPLPVGVSDYRLACEEYYYIDKTEMIRDFLDERPIVSLFTRPRRFGKTLNMDMLRTFFEKTGEDTSRYFQNRKIWTYGEKYRAYQGKYPVIFLSFKDVKCASWEETRDVIAQLIRQEFRRHSELSGSPEISNADFYQKIVQGQATENDNMLSLMYLSQMLDEHHGIAPIIIIDEYDTPIQQGYTAGFYDRIILFMRNFFSGGLKDNRHLSYGFLTGILRVAKESIFSGLNNLSVNSVLDDKYSRYFGFTTDEVREMAEYYGVTEKFEEICAWYDGYRFGNTGIFNPWSVINCFNRNCEAGAYWSSTGSNEIIGEILQNADSEIWDQLNNLLQGKSLTTVIDTGVIYPQVQKNPVSIYSFLLMAGYLTVCRRETAFIGFDLCEVALPNQEIRFVYQKEILEKLDAIVPQSMAVMIQQAMLTNNAEQLKLQLHRFLMESASCYDTLGENFYHGLMLGLCAMTGNHYFVSSNRESGEGRYDLQLMPKHPNMPGILIELKAAKNATGEALVKLSQKALQQMETQAYDTQMKVSGVSAVFKFGVAFSGKQVAVTGK